MLSSAHPSHWQQPEPHTQGEGSGLLPCPRHLARELFERALLLGRHAQGELRALWVLEGFRSGQEKVLRFLR